MDKLDTNTDIFNRFFYHTNILFSPHILTDEDGIQVESVRYDIYGQPFLGTGVVDSQQLSNVNPAAESEIGNPYLFTGQRYDIETGLYQYRYRYFDPELGRFVSRDPIGVWGDFTNLGNPFAYVGNNPLVHVDPFGLQSVVTDAAKEAFKGQVKEKVVDWIWDKTVTSSLAGLAAAVCAQQACDYCKDWARMSDRDCMECKPGKVDFTHCIRIYQNHNLPLVFGLSSMPQGVEECADICNKITSDKDFVKNCCCPPKEGKPASPKPPKPPKAPEIPKPPRTEREPQILDPPKGHTPVWPPPGTAFA
jgi:RHS repeat-associated protein